MLIVLERDRLRVINEFVRLPGSLQEELILYRPVRKSFDFGTGPMLMPYRVANVVYEDRDRVLMLGVLMFVVVPVVMPLTMCMFMLVVMPLTMYVLMPISVLMLMLRLGFRPLFLIQGISSHSSFFVELDPP